MKERLTQTFINSIKPNPVKSYWIDDTVTLHLRLHVGVSGKKVWYVRCRVDGKPNCHKLGLAGDAISVAQARDMANQFIAQLAMGGQPQKKPSKKREFGDLLTKEYEPWILQNHGSGQKTLNMLRSRFAFLLPMAVEDIRLKDIEKWRTERQTIGIKAATINRCTASLRSVFSWAVKRGFIEENPLGKLELLKQHDSDEKVRYLTEAERKRLMAALDRREQEMREARKRHNEEHAARGHEPHPELSGEFADHLKPMILISLNTGIRQNNLFSLLWGDIDFEGKAMTLRASVTKSRKTHHLPINSIVVKVLTALQKQSKNTAPDAWVFPSPRGGGKFDNCKKAWGTLMKEAKITNFRWHDMRHDFASQLVMRGVDLNTVRELMCHASLAMTLRYAHLAPKDKLRAAEVLTGI